MRSTTVKEGGSSDSIPVGLAPVTFGPIPKGSPRTKASGRKPQNRLKSNVEMTVRDEYVNSLLIRIDCVKTTSC